MQRIRPVNAVTGNDIVDSDKGNQFGKFRDIKLTVAVGKENIIKTSGFDTGTNGGAVAAVFRMMNDPNFSGITADKLLCNLCRGILAAVVDDDDLMLLADLAEDGTQRIHHFLQIFAFIVRRKESKIGRAHV